MLFSPSAAAALCGGTVDFRPSDSNCCRVAAVGPDWIQLERPLLHDLRVGWQVGLAAKHLGRQAPTADTFSIAGYPAWFSGT